MAEGQEERDASGGGSRRYRQVLLAVAALNGAMFLLALGSGLAARSLALQADGLDFLGDGLGYAVGLWALGRAPLIRARVALARGLLEGAVGLWVVGAALHRFFVPVLPAPEVMGAVGLIGCGVNVLCALLLLRYRRGEANVRSIWLASRNDALGSLAVVLAGAGVWASATRWPDLLLALVMAGLFLQAAASILLQAWREMSALPR